MTANIIPTDAPSIFDQLTTLEKQAIIRPDNPPPGIAGFLFDIEEDDQIELNSDITDHYVEDNTAIQDQISLKPEMIKVTGLVAELVAFTPTTPPLVPATNPLPLNTPMVPELDPQCEQDLAEQQAKADATTTANTSQQSLWNKFNSQTAEAPNQTRQSRAFLYFYALWKARALFTVQTPFGVMTSMAIQTITAKQEADSRYKSTFTMTFKKVRFAAELGAVPGQLAGRSALQATKTAQNGAAGQEPQTPAQKQSILYRLLAPLSAP